MTFCYRARNTWCQPVCAIDATGHREIKDGIKSLYLKKVQKLPCALTFFPCEIGDAPSELVGNEVTIFSGLA